MQVYKFQFACNGLQSSRVKELLDDSDLINDTFEECRTGAIAGIAVFISFEVGASNDEYRQLAADMETIAAKASETSEADPVTFDSWIL